MITKGERGCSVRSLSHVQLFATPWTPACQASLSFTISQGLLKLMSTESVMPFNHLTFCCSPFSSYPQSFKVSGSFPVSWLFASDGQSIGALASESAFPINIQGWRIDWFDLLDAHGTLKCLLQHHSSKASILRHSAFFMVQLTQPYMTTGKKHSFD